MNIKKAAIWTGLALLAFFLITQPHQSASLVGTLTNDLKYGAQGVISFVSSVFG
jgi:hypothetical protein